MTREPVGEDSRVKFRCSEGGDSNVHAPTLSTPISLICLASLLPSLLRLCRTQQQPVIRATKTRTDDTDIPTSAGRPRPLGLDGGGPERPSTAADMVVDAGDPVLELEAVVVGITGVQYPSELKYLQTTPQGSVDCPAELYEGGAAAGVGVGVG